MLNLKHSLVNLTIILFSLFVLTFSSADDSNFIFPKKKIILIKPVEKNLTKIELINKNKSLDLPQKKPIKTKAIKQKKTTIVKEKTKLVVKNEINNKVFTNLLPVKKPILQKSDTKKISISPFLEKDSQKKVDELKKNIELEKSKNDVKLYDVFLYPTKKPLNYSSVSTKVESKSKILREKDFLKAKNIFNLIKKGKWITALQQTQKVKDKEFKNLVMWLYLKERGNQATFNDYKNFISENFDYPRISRLKYMAEHKIILDNTTPKIIINWFNGSEPLSGTGKIKLGEAYLKVNENNLGFELIKSGWVNADLSSRDVKYYKKNLIKF